MKIRNYTSGIPAERSIMAIEMLLAKAGAIAIGKLYHDGTVSGLTFTLQVMDRPMAFRLPVHADRLEAMMLADVRRARVGTKTRIQIQSRRTAWKILHDWVSVQVAMIQLEQARPVEVFMPYLYDGHSKKTLYEHWQGTGFKQLTSGRPDET